MMRRGMRQALEQDGWQVGEAENGRVALARLAEASPRHHHARSDDAGDGRLRVPGRDAQPRGVAGHSGAGGDRQGPDRGGAQPPQRRCGARAAERRRRAGRPAAGDRPRPARVDRARPRQEGRGGNRHEDPVRRGQRRQHLHAGAAAEARRFRRADRARRRPGRGDGGCRAARPDPDGHGPAGARRLGGDAPDQGRAGNEAHSGDRADGQRDDRRQGESAGRGLRRLRYQAGGAAAPARQDPGAGAGGPGDRESGRGRAARGRRQRGQSLHAHAPARRARATRTSRPPTTAGRRWNCCGRRNST